MSDKKARELLGDQRDSVSIGPDGVKYHRATTTLRERVARAMFEREWNGVDGAPRWGEVDLDYWLSSADAAIALVLEEAANVAERELYELLSTSTPEGWCITAEQIAIAKQTATAIRALGE